MGKQGVPSTMNDWLRQQARASDTQKFQRVPGLNLLGTVDPFWTSGFPSVFIDGEEAARPGAAWETTSGYVPKPGDRVVVFQTPSTFIILGLSNDKVAHPVAIPMKVALPFPAGGSQYPLYEAPTASKTDAGIVDLKGMIATPSAGYPANMVLFTLPSNFWPDFAMDFGTLMFNNTQQLLRVHADGTITNTLPIPGSQWFSLSGISYPALGVADWTAVGDPGSLASFAAGFADAGDVSQGPCSYWVDPYNFVWWKGQVAITVAQTTSTVAPMISLDPTIAPLSLYTWQSIAKVPSAAAFNIGATVSPHGLAYRGSSGNASAIGTTFSLAQVLYPLSRTGFSTISAFTNGWSAFGGGYSAPAYFSRADGLAYVEGLVKGGTLAAAAFSIGSTFTSAAGRKLQLATSSTPGPSRFDLIPVSAATPQVGGNTWFSLDGFRWIRE